MSSDLVSIKDDCAEIVLANNGIAHCSADVAPIGHLYTKCIDRYVLNIALRQLWRYALTRRSFSKRTGLGLVQHSHSFNQCVAIPMHEEFVMSVGEFLPRQAI